MLTLVPIALAYNLAHYLSLLLISGQTVIPLLSDPFGSGWDLLGTAGYKVNIAIINARVAWYVSVAAIVAGHVVSVYLAHLMSLRRVAHRGRAPAWAAADAAADGAVHGDKPVDHRAAHRGGVAGATTSPPS